MRLASRAMFAVVPRNKFHAKRTEIDGYSFASQKEGRRFVELKMLQLAGLVSTVKVHPVYPLTVAGQIIGKYTADFEVVWSSGEICVEDVKSTATKTAAYSLRKRVFEACHTPLTVTEV